MTTISKLYPILKKTGLDDQDVQPFIGIIEESIRVQIFIWQGNFDMSLPNIYLQISYSSELLACRKNEVEYRTGTVNTKSQLPILHRRNK